MCGMNRTQGLYSTTRTVPLGGAVDFAEQQDRTSGPEVVRLETIKAVLDQDVLEN